jgi:hypothetical protein
VGTIDGMIAPSNLLAAVVTGTAVTVGSVHATGMTPARYSHAVSRICAGAQLFSHRHEIGTRAGAIAVSRDIRTTGHRRLRRVDAVTKPVKTARADARWIATERKLVDMYATNYFRIWQEIERAHTPAEHAKLPAVLHRLVHEADALKVRAGTFEVTLSVPDCTGG